MLRQFSAQALCTPLQKWSWPFWVSLALGKYKVSISISYIHPNFKRCLSHWIVLGKKREKRWEEMDRWKMSPFIFQHTWLLRSLYLSLGLVSTCKDNSFNNGIVTVSPRYLHEFWHMFLIHPSSKGVLFSFLCRKWLSKKFLRLYLWDVHSDMLPSMMETHVYVSIFVCEPRVPWEQRPKCPLRGTHLYPSRAVPKSIFRTAVTEYKHRKTGSKWKEMSVFIWFFYGSVL